MHQLWARTFRTFPRPSSPPAHPQRPTRTTVNLRGLNYQTHSGVFLFHRSDPGALSQTGRIQGTTTPPHLHLHTQVPSHTQTRTYRTATPLRRDLRNERTFSRPILHLLNNISPRFVCSPRRQRARAQNLAAWRVDSQRRLRRSSKSTLSSLVLLQHLPVTGIHSIRLRRPCDIQHREEHLR